MQNRSRPQQKRAPKTQWTDAPAGKCGAPSLKSVRSLHSCAHSFFGRLCVHRAYLRPPSHTPGHQAAEGHPRGGVGQVPSGEADGLILRVLGFWIALPCASAGNCALRACCLQ